MSGELPPPTPSGEPPAPPVASERVVSSARTPRAGELSTGWRVATSVVWIGAVAALAAVWNTSVQLGLATWWLGPRGDRQMLVVQLSPFFAPVLMLIAVINHVRWLAWWGLAASAVLVGYGLADLGAVTEIAIVEILIGAATALASLASLTGTYRTGPAVAG